ncbi:MAG: M23 family metallopeptidase [Oscillospiraceae bacterium]|nr:M23 family metallopeptidase [Oscillospiraceae bacterium]
MKKPMKDRMGDFMAGKGFYIVLFLCVATIGISGYYLFSSVTSNLNPTELGTQVAGQIQVTVTPSAAPAITPAATPAATPTLTPAPPVLSATPAPTQQPAAAVPSQAVVQPEPTPAALVFTWPVKGEILSAFSVEALAYDVTMEDWRTHPGLDIAADPAIQVRAAAAGTVAAVEQDPLMGTVVVIDHSDDLRSVYANLDPETAVSVGDSVYTGDTIGQIGTTAIAESALPSHLHFTMLKNDLPTDPMDYLPSRT